MTGRRWLLLLDCSALPLLFFFYGSCQSACSVIFFFGRDNIVECVLFDECANDIDMCQVQNMSGPVVIILYLARVAFREDGMNICNKFCIADLKFNLYNHKISSPL